MTTTALDIQAIKQSLEDSFNNKPFPEVVRALAEAGVERYHTDLTVRTKTYYGEVDHSYAGPLQDFGGNPPAETWSEPDVRAAITAIQQRQIGYAEFLRRILAAGVASYDVYIKGAKAIYVGRRGDFWVEVFPGRK